MTITTTTQISAPVNVIFQQKLLRNAKALCPYFIGSTPAEIMQNNGSFTAKWRRIENLTPTTTALTPLSGVESYPFRTGTAASITDYTATIQKYGQVYALNEEVNLVNYNGQTAKLVETLAISAGQSLNRLQRNEVEDNSTTVYATAGASADSGVVDSITTNSIRNVVNTLQRNVAAMFTAIGTGSENFNTSPIRPAYWGLCHVDVEMDVRNLPGFIASEKYALTTDLAPGEFGMVEGVRFISSPEGSIDTDSGGSPGNLRSTSGAAADLYSVVILGQDAHGSTSLDTTLTKEVYTAGDKLPGIIMINHAAGSSGAMDPLNELNTLAWKAWHAAVILNPLWIYHIRCGATKLI